MKVRKKLRRFYVRKVRPHLPVMLQQRLKLLLFAWAYLPLLGWTWMPRRLALLAAWLRIDWCVEHSHRPAEIMALARDFRRLPAGVMVEAGCFKGGSTAKWSLLCQRFGRSLYVYDSFEGVQEHHVAGEDFDFRGEYAAGLEVVRANVGRYGDARRCQFFKGWFADTLAIHPPARIALAYIDCDVQEGTQDALKGILPNLVTGGLVFTQDYHIPTVREWLDAPETWRQFAVPAPTIHREAHHTARLAFD